MEVVIRTPHEEAELVVRASESDLLLSDLLERVTGQPSPPVVTIDGRSVSTSSTFGSCGIVTGSVLSVLDPVAGPSHTVTTLVQAAGTGAGTRVDLEPGEFRIGPGRRVTAPELDFAPVDESAIQLTVQEDGGASVSHTGRATWVDGAPCEPGVPTPWMNGLVEVADRVFERRTDAATDPRPNSRRTVDRDGRSPFNRPPRRRQRLGSDGGPEYPHLDEALRMTTLDNRELWQRRASDPDAFHIPVGLAHAPAGGSDRRLRTIAVDLQQERGVGLVGGSDFTRAAARGLILHAATGFGPADLDIAVVTSTARAHAWEWTKWLPHTTVHDDPQLLSSEAGVRAWVRSLPSRPRDAPDHEADVSRHLTIVVVDEPFWWHDRGSPLRELLADEAAPVRFVVLGGSPEEIPALCVTVLEERQERGSVLECFSENLRIEEIHPFLPGESIAIDAARRLASFDDPERAATDDLTRELSLERMLGLDHPDSGTLAARWIAARGAPTLSARIGRSSDGLVECPLADGPLDLLVTGATDSGTGVFLESLIIGLALDHQPDDLNFVLFDLSGRGTFAACADLPHAVEEVVDPPPNALGRVLRCLRAEIAFREQTLGAHGADSLSAYAALREVPALSRLLIVLDEVAPHEPDRSEFVASLLDVIADGARYGIHLVAATHRHLDPSISNSFRRRLSLRLDATGDVDWAVLPRFVPGRAVLREGDRVTSLQTPNTIGDTLGARSPHAITPFVIGREPTAMERRLVRLNARAPDRSDDPRLTSVVETIVDAAVGLGQQDQRNPCLPPLPIELPLSEMLERFEGDGVPYALEDLPDEQRQQPRWWQPGPHGGLAIHGGSRTERTGVLLTLAIGIAARSSAEDVHLYVVGDMAPDDGEADDGVDDGVDGRLDRLESLPHTAAVIGLDDGMRLDALVQYLDEEITRRADLAEQWGGAQRVAAREPAIAILIDDVGQLRDRLRRHEDGDGILIDLERAIRDGGPYGICAVVTAPVSRFLPHTLPEAFDRLVLRPDDPAELAVLGLSITGFSATVPGRALRPAGPSEVQIAAPPDDIAAAIVDLSAEPAVDRPPHPITSPDPGGSA